MALSPEHEAFGAAARELRERRGVSQRALAEMLGSSQPTLSALEHGRRNPGLDTVFRLCECLDVSFAELGQAMARHRR